MVRIEEKEGTKDLRRWLYAGKGMKVAAAAVVVVEVVEGEEGVMKMAEAVVVAG